MTFQIRRLTLLPAIIIAILLLNITSCKDDEDVAKDEAIIQSLLTDSLISVIEQFDIEINKGTNPPSLENTFFISPLRLDSSNIPGDNIGDNYADLTLQILDQNNEDLTISIFSAQGDISQSKGSGGFITGEDDRFTLYVEQLNIRSSGSDSSITINIYSGQVTEQGIYDFKQLLIMSEDFGDPNNYYIEIGQGRLFVDSDGFSPLSDEDISGGRFDNANLLDNDALDMAQGF